VIAWLQRLPFKWVNVCAAYALDVVAEHACTYCGIQVRLCKLNPADP
jgi:hypothetical protein